MPVLDVTRTVDCPNSGEKVEVDNQCVFCDFYDGCEGGIENPGVICTFGDEEDEDKEAAADDR